MSRPESDKRLIVQIAGREALPVRAIPYVTGWKLSPDAVAKNFARCAGGFPFSILENIDAFHLSSGSPVKIIPDEWTAIVVQIEALEARLNARFTDDREGYAAWRNESVPLLPAEAFVWRDEFEKNFREDFSPDRLSHTNKRAEAGELTYTPMLPDAVRDMVLEGFQGVSATTAPLPEAEEELANPQADASESDLASLFDPVSPEQLEKMFPSEGKWKTWANKAKEFGLSIARKGRNKYNPYLAAEWWLEYQPHEGWDLARCRRVLAKNLPTRSLGSERLLTGEME